MRRLTTIILIGLAGAAGLFFWLKRDSANENAQLTQRLHEAYARYRQGEQASTLAERQESFNAALKLYSQLENEYHPRFSTGKLDYDIAGNYFQLEQYPWAILYYYRALKAMPRNEKAHHNLEMALQKVGLTFQPEPGLTRYLLLQDYLTLSERLTLFFYIALACFLLISLFIWRPWTWLKPLIALTAVCSLFFLTSLLFALYVAPLEGVLIRASQLYRDAGQQYSTVSNQPAIGGLKVKVLDVVSKGAWMKIQTPSGTIGFVLSDSVRVI